MYLIFTILTWLFAAGYGVALIAFISGTLGLFGVERDPLSGVFVYLHGLPWTIGLDYVPEAMRPWIAAILPLANLGILHYLARLARRHTAAA